MPLNYEEEESGSDHDHPGTSRHLFTDEDGIALCFLIHKSVSNKRGGRTNLTTDIEKYGGVVDDREEYADIIIINPDVVDHEALQLTYHLHPERALRHIWVEPTTFVQRCIREGVVRHRMKKKQGMGGFIGRQRVEYTVADDMHLCRHIAFRIPSKEAGGRSGDNIYKELIDMALANPEAFEWARRHTWQSWRNRYKKNAQRLDPIIDQIVKEEEPTDEQVYFRDRRYGRGHQRYEIGLSDEEPGDDEEAIVAGDQSEDEPEQRVKTALEVRRRVENYRSSVPSGLRAKRRRIEKQPQVSPVERPRNPQPYIEKEEYIVQQDNNDAGDIFESWEFNPDNEPGPSKTQRSLPSSPFRASQMTLVGTAPIINAQRHPRQSSVQLEPAPHPAVPVSELQEERAEISLRNQHQRQALEPIINEPTVQEANQENLVARPSQRRAAVKKAKRMLSGLMPPLVETGPPYRNTRSRSRSVEPVSTVPPPSKKVRKKSNTKSRPLEPLEETIQEDVGEVSSMPETQHTAPPPGETLEEEMNVEDILVNNVTDASVGSLYQEEFIPEVDGPDTPMNSTQVEGQPLETDDEQTNNTLRQPLGRPQPQHPTSNYVLDVSPEEMLRRLTELAPSMTSRRSSARPLTHTRSQIAKAMDIKPASSLAKQLIPQQSALDHSRLPRKGSTSSVESFPIQGTRASALKKKLEEQEKHSPYKPPAGTRAAQFR